jgi:hypothetical protein
MADSGIVIEVLQHRVFGRSQTLMFDFNDYRMIQLANNRALRIGFDQCGGAV